MKRYLLPILAILVLVSGLLVGCQSVSKPIPQRFDRPYKTEREMVATLRVYLTAFAQSTSYYDWAYPRFPLHKWSAHYKADGIWLVKAYDIDESYAGTWAVRESAHNELLLGTYSMSEAVRRLKINLTGYKEIQPYDETAKAITLRERRIGKPPPLPVYVRYSDYAKGITRSPSHYDKAMIQAVQLYIANMALPREYEAEREALAELQKLVRSHYPLDWRITYDKSLWVLTCVWYEDKFRAYIDPQKGSIKVTWELAW